MTACKRHWTFKQQPPSLRLFPVLPSFGHAASSSGLFWSLDHLWPVCAHVVAPAEIGGRALPQWLTGIIAVSGFLFLTFVFFLVKNAWCDNSSRSVRVSGSINELITAWSHMCVCAQSKCHRGTGKRKRVSHDQWKHIRDQSGHVQVQSPM